MLILVCAKYYELETKNVGDMTQFSELPEQPSYVHELDLNINTESWQLVCIICTK